MKKRTILWFMIAFFALVLGACGQKTSQDKSDETKGMKIVTSFYPVYSMVKEVSGDLNDVRMIQSSSGIHSFEPLQMILQPSMMQMSLFIIRIRSNLGQEVGSQSKKI